MELPDGWPTDFAHHRLEAWRVSFDAMLMCIALSKRVPRGYRSMADQLKRASTGTVAAITEGANRRTKAEKADKFAQARAEAGEAAGWCEILVALDLLPAKDALTAVLRLHRAVRLLSGLIRSHGGAP